MSKDKISKCKNVEEKKSKYQNVKTLGIQNKLRGPPPPSQNISHTLGPFGLKFSGMSDPGEKRF